MKNYTLSSVEKHFQGGVGINGDHAGIPYLLVENFPQLGMLTALRFLEWVSENPDGVISLPTGKTPEYFIKWVRYLLDNWEEEKALGIRDQYGIGAMDKPVLDRLHFVQIDEFYPIDPRQHNSFYYYVNEFYIKGLGLDPDKALFINAREIPLFEDREYEEVFPDYRVDLSLRYREAGSTQEEIQKESILMIDEWCAAYENSIRELGGIGFFLGGIGPDGHIAFNIRGSDHHSTTRLTETNFETQAVAAGDLGGIEISKSRLVITIGLKTITYKPDAVAIIIAAGEAKAGVVRDALEEKASNRYPASALQVLPNARFYLTKGAAVSLTAIKDEYYQTGKWTNEKTDRAVLDLVKRLDKYGHHLQLDDLRYDKYCNMIPDLSLNTVNEVISRCKEKIYLGMKKEKEQRFLHTGPHHDDIMLGILPSISQQLRQASNNFDFAILTSGFTAVTNEFIIKALTDILQFMGEGKIQMLNYPDFFKEGYKFKWDKDVYHYLDRVASGEPHERRRGLSHRLVRAMVDIYGIGDKDSLRSKVKQVLKELRHSYDGQKNSAEIQRLKGMLREFEEELVWAHFGVQVKNVHHLRLGFYTGDIFTEQPDRKRDVEPLLKMLKELKPTIISVALDPEGSGPDTHYKVLQVVAEAIRMWREEEPGQKLRVIGYRNVWYQFHPAEADVIVPVSLNSLAILEDAFEDCYLSQVEASFPSYRLDGKFSALARQIWIEQMKHIQLLLGKNFFYQNDLPKLRATHGLVYYKDMDVDIFLGYARKLERSMEG